MLFWLKKFISIWLMPLPLSLLAIVTGLLLLRSARRARLGQSLVLGGILLLGFFSNGLVSKWLIRPLEARYPAIPEFAPGASIPPALAACQFVVVLGGGNGHSPGVSANNLLSTSGLSRLSEAMRLLKVLPSAKLIVSGPGDGVRPTGARILGQAAIAAGVPPAQILYVETARDTEEEAAEVTRLVSGAPLALVSSASHLPRAVALFRHAGLAPLPCPADYRAHTDVPLTFDDFLWDPESLWRSTFAVRERIGQLWIALRGKS